MKENIIFADLLKEEKRLKARLSKEGLSYQETTSLEGSLLTVRKFKEMIE